MNNKLILSFIVLCVFLGLYFLNLSGQKNYSSKKSNLTNINKDSIQKILIQSNEEVLELVKNDTLWSISSHDTLNIKEQSLNNFFDKILNLELETTMTEKEEKWGAFNIGDSTGTHLALIDYNGNTLSYFVFGRSNSDYARCYVRTSNSSNVYLASENVMYIMTTNPNYWGEKPKENIPSE